MTVVDGTVLDDVLSRVDELERRLSKVEAENADLRRDVQRLSSALEDEQRRRRVLSGRVDSGELSHRWTT